MKAILYLCIGIVWAAVLYQQVDGCSCTNSCTNCCNTHHHYRKKRSVETIPEQGDEILREFEASILKTIATTSDQSELPEVSSESDETIATDIQVLDQKTREVFDALYNSKRNNVVEPDLDEIVGEVIDIMEEKYNDTEWLQHLKQVGGNSFTKALEQLQHLN